ncbi:MAG: hypothetical protein HY390_03640 [Deltaproteobacteria bacterium]|nr:hypothetical protein [Deltaproteobacteria bacterium]
MCKKIKKYFLFFGFILSILLTSDTANLFKVVYKGDPLCQENTILIEQKHDHGYDITVSRAEDWICQSIDIKKNGKLLFHNEEIGGYYFLSDNFEEHGNPFFFLPGNINPHFVFSKWTGGAHCCYSLHIFSLGQDFREVAAIEGGNSQPILKDLDGDHIPEIEVLDDFLAYLFSSFATSAYGAVILKYSNGKYYVAADIMKKPRPHSNLWKSKIYSWKNDLRKKGPEWPPPSLIQTMTDLIFTGNKKVAFDLIHSIWPPEVSGKNDFLSEYEKALAQSNFYPEFEKKLKLLQ